MEPATALSAAGPQELVSDRESGISPNRESGVNQGQSRPRSWGTVGVRFGHTITVGYRCSRHTVEVLVIVRRVGIGKLYAHAW